MILIRLMSRSLLSLKLILRKVEMKNWICFLESLFLEPLKL